MKIFKLIEVDLGKERQRINKVFTGRQKKVLLELTDLFEAGEWQKCLDFVNNKKNFGYDKEKECDEKEYIRMEIADILCNLAYYNYYTKEQLLNEAREIIKEERENILKNL